MGGPRQRAALIALAAALSVVPLTACGDAGDGAAATDVAFLDRNRGVITGPAGTLLWTDGPTLMHLPQDMLDTVSSEHQI